VVVFKIWRGLGGSFFWPPRGLVLVGLGSTGLVGVVGWSAGFGVVYLRLVVVRVVG